MCTPDALVGTLEPTGGVTNPCSSKLWRDLRRQSSIRDFTFTVDPTLPCGAEVIASLVMTDGTTNYGTFQYRFTVGDMIASFAENFDEVIALPVGWLVFAAGQQRQRQQIFGLRPRRYRNKPSNDVFIADSGTGALHGRLV